MAITPIKLSRRAKVYVYNDRAIHPTNIELEKGYELAVCDPVHVWHEGQKTEAVTIYGDKVFDGNCLLLEEVLQDLPHEEDHLPAQQRTLER